MSPRTASSALERNPTDKIGLLLDGWLELRSVLGVGAYGVVYSAIDVRTRGVSNNSHPQMYAVKALEKVCTPRGQNGKVANDASHPAKPSSRQRDQQREMQLHHLAGRHPNVVSLHRIMESPECTYVILEYCPEGDLFGAITETGAYLGNDGLIKSVFLQILDAVEYCHSIGIYHRDLKPENILCTDAGATIKLADFGLATTNAYTSDFGCGSTFYMSPECQQSPSPGSYYASAPNDVWSLGVVLVNLTCGRNPWKQADPATDATFRAFLKEPHFLRTILPISVELEDILTRIFTMDPCRRIGLAELKMRIRHAGPLTLSGLSTPPPEVTITDNHVNYAAAAVKSGLLPPVPSNHLHFANVGLTDLPVVSPLVPSVGIADHAYDYATYNKSLHPVPTYPISITSSISAVSDRSIFDSQSERSSQSSWASMQSHAFPSADKGCIKQASDMLCAQQAQQAQQSRPVQYTALKYSSPNSDAVFPHSQQELLYMPCPPQFVPPLAQHHSQQPLTSCYQTSSPLFSADCQFRRQSQSYFSTCGQLYLQTPAPADLRALETMWC